MGETTMCMGRRLKIFFDGGCRPNPGEMQVAVVARGVVHHVPAPGRGSSEEAEWLALLHALRVAEMTAERDIVLLGDAAGVIAQANGATRCRNAELRKHLDEFRRRSATFVRVRVRYIRRNQNLAGIALGRIGEQARAGVLAS